MEKERQKILENLWVRVLLIGFQLLSFSVMLFPERNDHLPFTCLFICLYFDPVVDFFERRCWPFTVSTYTVIWNCFYNYCCSSNYGWISDVCNSQDYQRNLSSRQHD